MSFDKDGVDWLDGCRKMAASRLPEVIYKEIPEEVWAYFVMGRYCVVRRFPRTSKVGRIIIAENAQVPTEAGWVLTVGPDVSKPAPNTPHFWPFEPVDLVGRGVVLHRARGIALRFSMTQREYQGDYIMIHIGEIHGVLAQISEDYWQPEKPAVEVATTRSQLIVQ